MRFGTGARAIDPRPELSTRIEARRPTRFRRARRRVRGDRASRRISPLHLPSASAWATVAASGEEPGPRTNARVEAIRRGDASRLAANAVPPGGANVVRSRSGCGAIPPDATERNARGGEQRQRDEPVEIRLFHVEIMFRRIHVRNESVKNVTNTGWNRDQLARP